MRRKLHDLFGWFHQWTKWSKPLDAEFGGVFGTYEAQVQVRTCEWCNHKDLRQL